MNYYYLHLWSVGDLDKETIFDKSVHPPIIREAGIEINDWPADDLFYSFPAFIVTERLKSLLTYWGFEKLKFHKIERINPGLNFNNNFPDTQLPRYWLVEFSGNPRETDLALWDKKYLVVSQKALDFLRGNRVLNAEADLLPDDIDEYFNSAKKNFWMNLPPKVVRTTP